MRNGAVIKTAGLLLIVLISGCGSGGGGSSTPPPSPSTGGQAAGLIPPAPSSTGTPVDDWATFAHDYRRTGFQAQTLPITKKNVGSMQLRWVQHVPSRTGSAGYASPLVTNGMVYIASLDGTVHALRVTDGSQVWEQSIGQSILMTPTVADGKLFVGTHDGKNDTFAALDAGTGAVDWSVKIAGCIRAEPAIVNGLVIEGTACGDPPLCTDGTVTAFDEKTGATTWSWKTTVVPNNGGGQWSPISYDGRQLYFGTGNVCTQKEPSANAVVALNPDGSKLWAFQPINPFSDDDFGGGAMLNNGQVFIAGKDGFLYDLDASTGHVYWAVRLGNIDGYGPTGTPTTDGSVILETTGFKSDPTKFFIPGGGFAGVDSRGKVLWEIATQHAVFSHAAISNGIAFVDLDSAIVALDPASGSKLWSYAASSLIYSSPAIVPSGLYTVDIAGDVYAFSLPVATSARSRRPSM